MAVLVDNPGTLFLVLFAAFVGAVVVGALLLRRFLPITDEEREDFNVVQAATLTLLALLIGFSLPMAVSRYDQRKHLEAVEANAIGTEYARADLLDAKTGARIQTDLIRYARVREARYDLHDPAKIARNERDAVQMQSVLWSLTTRAAKASPTAVVATVVTGMNDVINAEDHYKAATLDRIPSGVWTLMVVIALFACAVQGYGARGKVRTKGLMILILPVTVALSLTLISDIDSPQGGIIQVQPQNIARLLTTLQKPSL